MRMERRAWVCGLALVTAACGIKSVGDLEGSATDGGSDSGDDLGTGSSVSMSSTSITSAESVGEGEVDTGNPTEPTSSDVDTGNPTEPGCLPDDAMCEVERTVDRDAAQWSLDGFGGADEGITQLQCTITEQGGDGLTVWVTLVCGDEEVTEHVLEVVADPHAAIDIDVGLAVTLTYAVEPIFWLNRWFALRDLDGRLRLGGGEGSEVLPPAGAEIFEPLGLTVDAELCPSFEPCEPFDCAAARRQAIEFHFGNEQVLSIPDGTMGGIAFGDVFTLVVARAEELVESDTCDDVPPNWYSYLIYGEASG